MVVTATSFGTQATYWGMFPTLDLQESVIVTGGRLKRGAPVVVHRIDGRLYVLIENSEWGSQAAMGSSRSPTGIRRTSCLGTVRAHAITIMQAASASASAMADDPMRELEQHHAPTAKQGPSSKRRRLPLAGIPLACAQVPYISWHQPAAGARRRTLLSRCMWCRGQLPDLVYLFWPPRCPCSLLLCATS